ncbi:L-threonine-O-3-phosphate decarboxylase, partial [Methylobacterium variabile]
TVADLAAAHDADVVVVVNPNNPDGRIVPPRDLATAAARLAARGGWLVVDEAFADLDPVESLCGAVPPAGLVLRSFGKTYGLAGLRLGFAVAAEPLAGLVRRGLGPWAVSGPAIAVGRHALADSGWRREAAAARGRDAARLDAVLEAAGGRVVGGTKLFRTADFSDGPALFGRLGRAGIFVRRFEAAPARLRLGLPPDEAAWTRLAAALGGPGLTARH